eukprot:SAG22_NODE_7579_length_727_cov_1.111465_1_plen_142_part_10
MCGTETLDLSPPCVLPPDGWPGLASWGTHGGGPFGGESGGDVVLLPSAGPASVAASTAASDDSAPAGPAADGADATGAAFSTWSCSCCRDGSRSCSPAAAGCGCCCLRERPACAVAGTPSAFTPAAAVAPVVAISAAQLARC